jgi:hypothetical protein
MSYCSNTAKSSAAKTISAKTISAKNNAAKIADPIHKTLRTVLLVNIVSVS